MKKILIMVITLAMLLTTTSISNAETFIVTTKKDPLNIRLAEDHSQILGEIAKGKTLEALYTDSYWAYFYYQGKLAVAYTLYLTSTSNSGPETPSTPTGSSTSSYKPQYVSTDMASKLFVVTDTIRDHLTVRRSKSASSRALGKLYPGDLVYVVNTGSQWTRIVYDNQYAFVLSKYIEEFGPNLPDEGELYKVSVKNGTTLNVREEGNKNSTILRAIPNDAYVKVIEQGEKWSKVYYSNQDIGYVMNKFIVPVE